MGSTFLTLLIGVVFLFTTTLVSWFFLTAHYRGILVVVRFFHDTAGGRELMRQAGDPPKLTEARESVLRSRLVTIESLTRWGKRLFIGISLIAVTLAAHSIFSPIADTQRFRTTILTAAAVQLGITLVVVGVFYWAKRRVFGASGQDAVA